MRWIIQGDLSKEDGLSNLIKAVKDKNLDYRLVKPIPFTNLIVDLDLDINGYNADDIPQWTIENDKPMITMGSYTLARIAQQRKWTPGSFINENFEFSKWVKGWGIDNMLNGDATEAKVKDIIVPDGFDKIFARPSEDTKFFAGQVFERDNLRFWLKEVMACEDSETLNAETYIIIAPYKEILAEYRLFVIDGIIVTGSLYKIKDQVITGVHLDPVAIDFAKKMIAKWEPDRAYVLDIAITENGPKIIEINNMNSSGFYKSDVSKIVDAIETMKF